MGPRVTAFGFECADATRAVAAFQPHRSALEILICGPV
jgi:hypothetical protein